jgi:hypothetical protein
MSGQNTSADFHIAARSFLVAKQHLAQSRQGLLLQRFHAPQHCHGICDIGSTNDWTIMY